METPYRDDDQRAKELFTEVNTELSLCRSPRRLQQLEQSANEWHEIMCRLTEGHEDARRRMDTLHEKILRRIADIRTRSEVASRSIIDYCQSFQGEILVASSPFFENLRGENLTAEKLQKWIFAVWEECSLFVLPEAEPLIERTSQELHQLVMEVCNPTSSYREVEGNIDEWYVNATYLMQPTSLASPSIEQRGTRTKLTYIALALKHALTEARKKKP